MSNPQPGWFDRQVAAINAQRPKLLLDMDGVLVDFVAGALAIHKKSLPYADVTWNFFKQIGIEEREFWKPCDFHFWATLDWIPQGRVFLDSLISRYGEDRICFCTSPCETIGSVEGKIEWIRRNLPRKMQRQFMITPAKQFAAKGNVLIDDSPENCKKFEAAGGKTVLVPQPWNERWRGKMYDPQVLICDVEAVVGD